MADRSKARGTRGQRQPAQRLPVAEVCVDVPLAHLDRPFDYLVTVEQDADAMPGVRVRVRFAGKLVDGFLLRRKENSTHHGRLAYLERVTSAQAVLTDEIAVLARAVADRYAGTMIDVLRLAIPPRHAAAEKKPSAERPPPPALPSTDGWQRYPRGTAYLDALRHKRSARAVWQALPGEDWPARLAEAAVTVAATDRVAVLVVPDHRDLARLHTACAALLGEHRDNAMVSLTADVPPAQRYARWLAVRRGSARVVIGTRSAVFAPAHDLGLLAIWDDGDDLHAEPRAPYPHVRDVLVQRSHATGASLLVGGFARTAEAQLLVDSGWAHEITATRDAVRASAPRVSASGDSDFELARDPVARTARVPAMAFDAARSALTAGAPVLVQVPRRGYLPVLGCAACRRPARCRRCAGPLGLPASAESANGAHTALPTCRWCGVTEGAFRCAACGSARLRAMVVGAGRTAEELGKAFANAPVRTSGAGGVLDTVADEPALIVATPGAEPVAERGYGAALLLDGWALLVRADLRAAEEALRRWLAAAALVRPASGGGRVVVVAESTLAPVQALVRWDPGWHARTELAARTELGFPPAVRMAAVDGSEPAVDALLDELPRVDGWPASADVLGPVPVGHDDSTPAKERVRALIRVPRADGRALADVLRAAIAVRTARKEPDQIRVRLDPVELM